MSRQLLHRRYFGPLFDCGMAQCAQTTFVSVSIPDIVILSSFLPRFIGESPVGEHGEHTNGEPNPGGDAGDSGLHLRGVVTQTGL